jgi:hypothetical protein
MAEPVMEEPPIEEGDPNDRRQASGARNFVKGLLLIFGGVLLGFFGCVGGLSAERIDVAILMLAGGAIVIIWGVIMAIIGIWRAFTNA